MVTTYSDRAGNQIIVDGSTDSVGAGSNLSVPELLAILAQGADSPCSTDTTTPPPGNWKYAIYRDDSDGYCRIITPGMAWGSESLGTYDTFNAAQAAMQQCSSF
jgi:hypothetical protein